MAIKGSMRGKPSTTAARLTTTERDVNVTFCVHGVCYKYLASERFTLVIFVSCYQIVNTHRPENYEKTYSCDLWHARGKEMVESAL